jgi:hypothetical protein
MTHYKHFAFENFVTMKPFDREGIELIHKIAVCLKFLLLLCFFQRSLIYELCLI